nr:hypothetical protein Iba_chr12aCG13700 [Ipomoea batatas]
MLSEASSDLHTAQVKRKTSVVEKSKWQDRSSKLPFLPIHLVISNLEQTRENATAYADSTTNAIGRIVGTSLIAVSLSTVYFYQAKPWGAAMFLENFQVSSSLNRQGRRAKLHFSIRKYLRPIEEGPEEKLSRARKPSSKFTTLQLRPSSIIPCRQTAAAVY